MLRSAKDLFGYRLEATDGEIGSIQDLIFDERTLTIHYVVAETGGWFSGHKVLLSTAALHAPEWYNRSIPISMTKEQIKDSPGLDADQTVSRRKEEEMHKYYGWAPYWLSAPPPGDMVFVPPMGQVKADDGSQEEDDRPLPHLRSVREVTGYHIQATDGEIGHVEDFVFEDNDWIIRYMVMNTRNLLPGKSVLASPAWIRSIQWNERKVNVDASQEAIKEAPRFDPSQPVNRAYESRLYDYYGRPTYW